jgi:hypothetical protein
MSSDILSLLLCYTSDIDDLVLPYIPMEVLFLICCNGVVLDAWCWCTSGGKEVDQSQERRFYKAFAGKAEIQQHCFVHHGCDSRIRAAQL